jgi:tetratricopeptide (TPR) repeat protein
MRVTLAIVVFLIAVWLPISYAAMNDPASGKTLDEQIQLYQEKVKKNSGDVVQRNQLAYAYIRKVRATADQAYNDLAEKLLTRTLEMDSNNYEALVYLGLVHMSQHRFSEAKVFAKKAIEVSPDHSDAYGVLGDASFELGLYNECADAYQRMMDLRPSTAAYSRVFYYRRLTGDLEGATAMMLRAYQSADFRDPENIAWCLLQLGNLSFNSGKIEEAEIIYQKSLDTLPKYFNAFAALGKVKAAQGKTKEAIALYQKAIAIVPLPEFVASLGDLYQSIGNTKEAEKQYQLVEYIGLISKANQEVYNRSLALFYADHDRKLKEALTLAQNEIEVRKDVYGYDALAWCLYKNGNVPEAAKAMQEALKMETKDSILFFHAGMIYEKLSRLADAKKYLEQARALNPHFHLLFAKTAEETIQKIDSKEPAAL